MNQIFLGLPAVPMAIFMLFAVASIPVLWFAPVKHLGIGLLFVSAVALGIGLSEKIGVLYAFMGDLVALVAFTIAMGLHIIKKIDIAGAVALGFLLLAVTFTTCLVAFAAYAVFYGR